MSKTAKKFGTYTQLIVIRFSSIVGPSGCGKTEVLFRMLKGSTFYPCFEKIYYFHKEFQQLFKDMQRVIPGIQFIKYAGFDITKIYRIVCLSMTIHVKKSWTT